MSDMPATKMLEILDAHKSRVGASDLGLARDLGLTRQAVSLWRKNGLKALPDRETLHAMGRVTGVPYRRILTAALIDAGYLVSGQNVVDESDSSSAAISVGAHQLRDLFREDFSAWTGTAVEIIDSSGDSVGSGDLMHIDFAVTDEGIDVPTYEFADHSQQRWRPDHNVVLLADHPPVPGLADRTGALGRAVRVSDLRIGDHVLTWRGNGRRRLQVTDIGMAQDEWGEVAIGFVDTDSGERIVHPNLRYTETYETRRTRE